MTGRLETQVVVAGAGPVGLVAALILAKAGVEVILLEKRSGLIAASKASTFHPATLEILATLGVLDAMLAEGEIVRRIQYRTPEGPFAEFALADLSDRTPYPFRLHLEQARITPLLLAQLRQLPNVRVLFDAEFKGVDQDGGIVTVRAIRDGKPLTISATYLLGADGAHSEVRKSLGLAFDGAVYPDKILRVMTHDDLDIVLPGLASITYLYNGEKSVSFLKMPDCWRIILRVSSDTPDDTALRDSWFSDRLRDVLPTWSALPGIVGKDVYGASRRVASDYFVGNAFLIGDSAHVTNTRGGMNMNCGIHDALTLASAMIEGLRTGQRGGVVAAARERKRVAEEMLIPRTDRNVAGGTAWLEKVRQIASSPDTASDYLSTAAMLDMVERPAYAN